MRERRLGGGGLVVAVGCALYYDQKYYILQSRLGNRMSILGNLVIPTAGTMVSSLTSQYQSIMSW